MKDLICKIFGAEFWHDSVEIMGNRKALVKLRNAIDRALKEGHDQVALMEADGEGYHVNIYLEDRNWKEWKKLPLHYSDTELTGGVSTEQEKEFLNVLKKQ